jgi:sarcosine oxidase subunit delta
MILLPCPWCGPRDAGEFHHIGEVTTRPDPRTADRAQWRDYLYFKANPRGWTAETWYHGAGCRRFIRVERHTETNEVRSSRQAGSQSDGLAAAESPDGAR